MKEFFESIWNMPGGKFNSVLLLVSFSFIVFVVIIRIGHVRMMKKWDKESEERRKKWFKNTFGR